MKRPAPRKPRRPPAAEAVTRGRAAVVHPLEWLLEPLESHPGYFRRKIFGCEAAYLNGRLMLVLAAGEEPWNGLMVATARESHAALQAQWAPLSPHPVLGKWLYLSQDAPAFERVATDIVEQVRIGHAHIGVTPRPRKPRRGKLREERAEKRAPRPRGKRL